MAEYLNSNQAARALKCTRQWFYKLREKHKLTGHNFGTDSEFYAAADVEKLKKFMTKTHDNHNS